MNDVVAFVGIALGVIIAVIYPVLRGYIKKEFPDTAAPGLPPWVRKYAALFAFSLLTAFIILGVYRNSNPDKEITFWAALAMGFGWEASIEKIFTTRP
jgi:predicted lysophospholipase L1 biosynthesis ABC-type transport system permease subunit